MIINRVETIDGSANEGEDYVAINETLTFEPYQKEKEVRTVEDVAANVVVMVMEMMVMVVVMMVMVMVMMVMMVTAGERDHCGRQPVGTR